MLSAAVALLLAAMTMVRAAPRLKTKPEMRLSAERLSTELNKGLKAERDCMGWSLKRIEARIITSALCNWFYDCGLLLFFYA
jgi:hypothetical protein